MGVEINPKIAFSVLFPSGQLIIFSGVTFFANSTDHLDQIKTVTPRRIIKFGGKEYTAYPDGILSTFPSHGRSRSERSAQYINPAPPPPPLHRRKSHAPPPLGTAQRISSSPLLPPFFPREASRDPGCEATRGLSFLTQIHAKPPRFFTNPGADSARKPTAGQPPPPRGPPPHRLPLRPRPRRHGEQHLQVPLRRLLRPLRRRLPAPRRARLRRRARPRHPRLPAHQARPRGAQPPRRLLRHRAGQLVQEAASGVEESQAGPDDAGGSRAPRGADAQEPPEGRRRRPPRLLRPPSPERGRVSATARRRSPRSSGPAQRAHAQAPGRQVRAAHAPGGRQGRGRRRHGDRVRGHVGRPGRDQEGRGGAHQGARRQELPHGRRAAEDHRRRGIQDGSQRQGRGGARQEVQDQVKWGRRAGERDAVREGGQGGTAEAGGGQVPDGARLHHRPLRQVRRGSPRRRGVRAGANVEERLRVALHRLRQTPGTCQVAEPGAGRAQGPVGVVQAAGAVGIQEGEAQRHLVIRFLPCRDFEAYVVTVVCTCCDHGQLIDS